MRALSGPQHESYCHLSKDKLKHIEMNNHFKEIVLEATGATDLAPMQKLQELWSGYGEISRYRLINADIKSVVIKHIRLPEKSAHPRGWNTDISHQRKIKSYEVEAAWYQHWSGRADDSAYMPTCLAMETQGEETLIVLEDLNNSGFDSLRRSASLEEMKVCLSWLANFHATYMGEYPIQLWECGTYWHLDTRPDELQVLDDLPLKQAATKIDQLLKESPYQTFVHGDAKLANFCFSSDGKKVAAVDFQYVGGGCGMKDVAYFIGSCLHEEDCEAFEAGLLNHYFSVLKKALATKKPDVDTDALEENWRTLFPIAWTDFHRFMKGWSPGHWKINSYSERLAREMVASL